MTLPIGDTLFAYPALKRVRQRFPDAQLTVLALPSNANIVKRYPEIDELLVFHKRHWWTTAVDLLRLGAQLRKRTFDLAIEMNPTGAIFSVLGGVHTRVSFGFKAFWWVKPKEALYWKRRHAVFHYGDLVSPLGIQRVDPRLELRLAREDHLASRSFLTQHGLPNGTRFVTMHPGASASLKRWNPRRFAELADRLASAHDVRVVIVGSKTDRRTIARMVRAMRSAPIVAAEKLTIAETAALQASAAMHVGNDSGPLHLAVAVGTPTVGLFGPTNPRNFGQLGMSDTVLHRPLPCSPCAHFVGGSPKLTRTLCRNCGCLEALSVDDVEAACLQRLQQRT